MWRFILVTFAFLGFAFWELSGGAQYAPHENSIQARAAAPQPVQTASMSSSAPQKTDATKLAASSLAALENKSGQRFEITLASTSDTPQGGQALNVARSEKVTITNIAPADAPKGTQDKIRVLTQPNTGEDAAVLAALDQTSETNENAQAERVWPGAIELFKQQANQASMRQEAEQAARASMDIRFITANSANMRGGPGTDYGKVGRLTEGAEVAILNAPGNGWVELQVMATGETGWMADWLISAPAQ